MKPWVIFNATMSLDARLGHPGRETNLTTKLDHDRFQKLQQEVSAVLVGLDSLPDLEKEKLRSENLRIVIVDPKAKISLDDEIFSHGKEVIIVTSSHIQPFRITRLKKKAKVIVTGKYVVNLPELLKKLSHSGIRKILLEDHGNLAKRMFEESLVQELYLLVSPLFLGDGCDLLPELKKTKKKSFSLEGITQYGDRVLLHYLVK